ncbi:hypothetical protein KGP36_02450 [Patescibacteria group bacterium]|nr:hypothetical protein [Patescibacteria group bacterium]
MTTQDEIGAFCREHSACAEAREWLKAEGVTTLAETWDTCPRADWMVWMLRRTDKWDKPMMVKIAIACAEQVLGIYETRQPGDDRPRKAIEAAKAYLADPSEKNREKARKSAAAAAYAAAAAAAYAAYAAAYPAYAAAAADDAADAAAYAAYAAAYPAYAAAAADDAADAAAYAAYAVAAPAARAAMRKRCADAIREAVGNPFKSKRPSRKAEGGKG